MSKSKPQSQTTSTSTSIPDWLQQPAQEAVQRADDLSNQPYQPYTGQIVAGTPQDTQDAYQAIRNMQGQTTPAYNTASNAWQGVLGNLQTQTPEQQMAYANQYFNNYQNQVMNPATSLLSPYTSQGPLTAAQVGQNAQALMSPYTQSVIDPANALMKQQLQQNLNTIGAGANQSGAFGGSRQGVMEGIAQSQAALGSEKYLGDMLNNQWGNALSTGYQTGALGAQQGYGATSALAGLLAPGYQQANTSAAGLMNTNLGLGTAAAGAIPQLATGAQTANQKDASLLQTIGAAQQGQYQSELDAAMSQFYAQQDDPTQKLNLLISTLGGVPYGTTSSSTGTQMLNKNVAAGALGGAASGAALGSAIFPGVGTAIGAVAGGLLGGLS